MAAAASIEDPTHTVQVPPLSPRGPPLRWLPVPVAPPAPREPRPPLPPPPPPLASARLAAQQRSTTSRSAHSGRTHLVVAFILISRSQAIATLFSRNWALPAVVNGFFPEFPRFRSW
nr:unnamed protein product [Digitaria exilis]